MELTKEQIDKINEEAPNDWYENEQGIFTEPYGIPTHIKESVIYQRINTGGVSGGSCWDDSNPQYYSKDSNYPFIILDLVLKELIPNISYLQFKEIESLIHTNNETEYEYYGNSTEWEIKYVILSELIDKLKHI